MFLQTKLVLSLPVHLRLEYPYFLSRSCLALDYKHNMCQSLWLRRCSSILNNNAVSISPTTVSAAACIGKKYVSSSPRYPNKANTEEEQETELIVIENKYKHVKDKILFNSVLESIDMKHSWFKRRIAQTKVRKKVSDNLNDFPVALKYFTEYSDTLHISENSIDGSEMSVDSTPDEIVHMPYAVSSVDKDKYGFTNGHGALGLESVSSSCVNLSDPSRDSKNVVEPISSTNEDPTKWMGDYEHFNSGLRLKNKADEGAKQPPWELSYGTPDKSIPVSNVPCGGCGALLHCQDTAIPGYLPSELFQAHTRSQLRGVTCQRCHFMRHYNTALGVSVPPEEYPRLLTHIRDKFALVLLMVDLTDFPCSLWPGIRDIIGPKRPVILVGNKVDLLPADSRGYLNHITTCLHSTAENAGLRNNLRHVALVSAKTGFGVEELINKLHNIWWNKGDVYLVGCTNVGKSSLFNALLQSDYCKVKAIDLLQRATTSVWPGTTLNLLKFPIERPNERRMYQRTKRLKSEQKENTAEKKLQEHQFWKTGDVKYATPMGHIGRTFSNLDKEVSDPFAVPAAQRPQSSGPTVGLNPNDKDFWNSNWCYDTPGTVQPDQILPLLTTEELVRTIPKELIVPRTFCVKPETSVFLGGVGRLDYLQGPHSIRLTVFVSEELPVTVCRLPDADDLYDSLVGSELLGVPSGGATRLSCWEGLTPKEGPICLEGEGWNQSTADVVLSSAGWVSVTSRKGDMVVLRAWTPFARGVHVRTPPLLRYSVAMRGPRLKGSVAYRKGAGVYAKHDPAFD